MQYMELSRTDGLGAFCRTNKKLKELKQSYPTKTNTTNNNNESPYVITFQVWSENNKNSKTPSNRPPTNLYQVRRVDIEKFQVCPTKSDGDVLPTFVRVVVMTIFAIKPLNQNGM